MRIGARLVVKCTQDTCRASSGVAVLLEILQRYCGRRFRLVKNKQTAFGRVWVGSWRTRGDPGPHPTSFRHLPPTRSPQTKGQLGPDTNEIQNPTTRPNQNIDHPIFERVLLNDTEYLRVDQQNSSIIEQCDYDLANQFIQRILQMSPNNVEGRSA